MCIASLILKPNLLSIRRTWPIIARSACLAICVSTILTALPVRVTHVTTPSFSSMTWNWFADCGWPPGATGPPTMLGLAACRPPSDWRPAAVALTFDLSAIGASAALSIAPTRTSAPTGGTLG